MGEDCCKNKKNPDQTAQAVTVSEQPANDSTQVCIFPPELQVSCTETI